MKPLVSVRDAVVAFGVTGGTIRAVDGVTLDVFPNETLAVVGESGCGKTTLARAILGLQPLTSGSIAVKDEPVAKIRRDIAERVGIVWQDPYASLDPRWTVGRSILEPARLTGRKVDLDATMREVGLDPSMATRYPHQLSGGQRQRVAIGRALALRPPVVLCDEPTAALDLSIRAQILNLLKQVQSDLHCAFLYISHDLMTVRHVADRVAVMYMGKIVEQGPTEVVFSEPRHPYTRALLDSVLTLEDLGKVPVGLSGELPDPRQLGQGCRFASRCVFAQPKCQSASPVLEGESGHQSACHFPLAKVPIM